MKIEGIEVEVIKKNIKNINLSVHKPNGRVRISAPNNVNDQYLKEFTLSKLTWIKKQIEKLENQPIKISKEFISGENHYFLGNKYLLKVIEGKSKQKVMISDTNHLNLYVRKNSTKEKREKIMTEWYRNQLKHEIPKYIEKWEAIMNVSVNEWNVKKMKTLWGSCNVQAKRIWVNLELAKKSPKFLEYLIVHEMVHLFERNHNAKFKAYMDKFLPNWRNLKKELNSG